MTTVDQKNSTVSKFKKKISKGIKILMCETKFKQTQKTPLFRKIALTQKKTENVGKNYRKPEKKFGKWIFV